MFQLIMIGGFVTEQYMCDTYQTACKLACERFIPDIGDIEYVIAVSAILNLIDTEAYDKAIKIWNYMNPDVTYQVREVTTITDDDIDLSDEMANTVTYMRETYEECNECDLPLGHYGCPHMKD